jgi:hypothetical protein
LSQLSIKMSLPKTPAPVGRPNIYARKAKSHRALKKRSSKRDAPAFQKFSYPFAPYFALSTPSRIKITHRTLREQKKKKTTVAICAFLGVHDSFPYFLPEYRCYNSREQQEQEKEKGAP